jgi:hypothetical protein
VEDGIEHLEWGGTIISNQQLQAAASFQSHPIKHDPPKTKINKIAGFVCRKIF